MNNQTKCKNCNNYDSKSKYCRIHQLPVSSGKNCSRFSLKCLKNIINPKETSSKNSVRDYNIGTSNYSKYKTQPWDIWMEYHLNPWDADIVKRILRTKEESGMSDKESRKMDYQKIIHVCQERIRQIEEGYEF